MMHLDQLIDTLQRAPRKLKRRALRLHKRLLKQKLPKRRKRATR